MSSDTTARRVHSVPGIPGCTISGEFHHGAVANVPISDALYHIQDITKLSDWGLPFVDCVLVDNAKEGWELGCRRRTVVNKAPYTDLMIREELKEREITSHRGRIVLEYAPITHESSFSSLKLDTRQKIAKAAKNTHLVEAEAPHVSELVGSTTNPYSTSGLGHSSKTDVATTGGSRSAAAPTVLAMMTTFTLSSISAHGGCQTFIEIRIAYSLSCETPGENDERIRYDDVVLCSFLEHFWLKEISTNLVRHLNNSVCPLSLLQGNGRSAPAGNATFQETANSLKLPMPYAKEHIEFEKLATEFAVAAKTPQEERVADAFQSLLSSWEHLLIDIRDKENLVARSAEEVAAARHITMAANQLSSATMRAAVLYENDGKW